MNDAIDAARDIARLDESAASRSVRVITGCGFNPGISTAMLCRWRGHDVVEVRECLRSESGEAGATALHSLLMTLATERRCLTNGAESLQRQPVIEAGAVSYESPDIDGVRRIWPAVQEFRYQVQFSGLPERSMRTLSSRKIYKQPVVQRGLAKLLAAVARRRAANVAEPPASTLEVVARDQAGNTYIQRLQGAGSYDLTAFAAAQCALWMLRHRATLQGGVHTIDCVNGLGDFLLFQLQQCAMATIDQYEQEDM
ncbi:hypothetical protein [Corynebacterium sp.]|uniref:hypothetical protein n=1 Tax=Corynebacterium sp. TaxID=1720 RepID=UPI0026DB0BB9|nr:hypothetical protein [Corynebacterium sp.]MDO5077825.1 hypothetical protein [Corynebacterium sp.]